MPDDALRWWINNPREWNAHPLTVVYGFVATLIVGVLFAVVFWIKGKWFS